MTLSTWHEKFDSMTFEKDVMGARGSRKWECWIDTLDNYVDTIEADWTYGGVTMYIVRWNLEPDADGCGYGDVNAYYSTDRWESDLQMEQITISSDVLAIEGGVFWADGSGEVTNASIALPMPKADLAITVTEWEVPTADIMAWVNVLNNAPWRDYPIGTVCFMGAQSAMRWDYWENKPKYRTTYLFSIKQQDWNLLWNPTTSTFSAVEDAQGNSLFSYDDYSVAFQFLG